ncbi:hypothetical protein EXIGLDRAFT_780887 [Exidia glandulosa HHB12029]|uniref:Uncharacterized protein n=1 Tax=Exidia glandulosa HHB12029 TaxID=1314781 RepID=A0A165BF18_EXIGL|nr:hypothetical protein EXIGLDRAFT_780887 [Exidia glandulosa HHB12029]
MLNLFDIAHNGRRCLKPWVLAIILRLSRQRRQGRTAHDTGRGRDEKVAFALCKLLDNGCSAIARLNEPQDITQFPHRRPTSLWTALVTVSSADSAPHPASRPQMLSTLTTCTRDVHPCTKVDLTVDFYAQHMLSIGGRSALVAKHVELAPAHRRQEALGALLNRQCPPFLALRGSDAHPSTPATSKPTASTTRTFGTYKFYPDSMDLFALMPSSTDVRFDSRAGGLAQSQESWTTAYRATSTSADGHDNESHSRTQGQTSYSWGGEVLLQRLRVQIEG